MKKFFSITRNRMFVILVIAQMYEGSSTYLFYVITPDWIYSSFAFWHLHCTGSTACLT